MNNNLQVFNFHHNEVRTIVQNDGVWFCLKDVCEILEIKNQRDCKTRLNQKGVVITDTLTKGGIQKLTYINESNLYKVIFQSRKSEAEEFTDYVTGTILPSIRKHGAYMNNQTLEQALTNPDFLIKLATELKEEQQKRKELELQKHNLKKENKEMKPKALFADAVSTSEQSILVGQLAKLIKQNGYDIGQNRLFQWMRDNDYLIKGGQRKNQPTQKAMDLGLFEVKERAIDNPDGSVRITLTTKVTGKGQIYFVNKFCQ